MWLPWAPFTGALAQAPGTQVPGTQTPGTEEPAEPGARGGTMPSPRRPEERDRREAHPPAPTSPAEEAAARAAELDSLFARLADRDARDWREVQARIWRLWSESGSATIDLLMARAEEALGEGDSELALEFLDDVVRLAPDYAEGWNRRAILHFERGELGRAVADIRRALALEPRHFGALNGLGMILERTGDEKAAYEAYRAALEINPHLPGAREAIKRLAPKAEGRTL